MRLTDRKRFLILLVVALGLVFTHAVCAEPAVTSPDQLSEATFAILTGTTCGPDTEKHFPNAKIEYYNTIADTLAVMRAEKADATVIDKGTIRFLQIDNKDIVMIGDVLEEIHMAPAFPKTDKGQALCDEYSAFVRQITDDGTLEEIDGIWFGDDESARKVLDYENLPDTNGTLTLAVDASITPFAYMKDRKIVGYDVDIAARFCEANGYRLKVSNMSFDSILAAVQTSKCDFASCGITVTEERAESMLFGEPIFTSGNIAAVIDHSVNPDGTPNTGKGLLDEDTSIWGQIRSSFEKTFIREDRWMLFVKGVANTLIITLMSALLGTLLGFFVFVLCRSGNRAANGITRVLMYLVQGMPMVVLLMILYYIVFGQVKVGGLVVAVIGFTLTFAASVIGLLRMGVGAVDNGQYEAAYMLGYSDRRIFYKIILPQALPHIVPSYKGEIIALIKATAVVGYIAVQDLTKMGDIIRSRTYEAFFPLIAVTVIYFILEGILRFGVSRIGVNLEPKRRRRRKLLEGVETDD